MKTTFVIQSLKTGGAQRAVVSLANHLVLRNMDVTIYLFSENAECAYELDSRVVVHAADLLKPSSNPLSAIKNNVMRLWYLRNFLLAGNAGIVVGMSHTINVLLSLATFRTNIIAIGSERSHPEFRKAGLAWNLLRVHSYKALQTLVCLTNDTARWVESNTSAQEVAVIPNGIQLPLATTSPIVEMPKYLQSKMMILSVGRLIPTKQFDQLISIFANISSDHPEWVLVIAGDGPEREALDCQIRELNLENRIFLVGTVGNLHDWYTSASVFVFLSRLEGFPNSLLEAMAYGLACISYDCKTGPKDLIEHGNNGELVTLNDKSAIQARLANVLQDPVYRAKLSEIAVGVNSKFSMDTVSEQWYQLLLSHMAEINSNH